MTGNRVLAAIALLVSAVCLSQSAAEAAEPDLSGVLLWVIMAAIGASYGYRELVISYRMAQGRPPITKWTTPAPAFFLKLAIFVWFSYGFVSCSIGFKRLELSDKAIPYND